MAKVWKARNTVIRVKNAVSVLTTALLDTTVDATAIENKCKNVTITEPEGAIEKIDLLGENATDFQNAELDDKPYTMATITGTMLMDGDEVLETWMSGSGTAVPTSPTHTRYQVGASTSGKTRIAAAILVNLDETEEVNILLNNAYFTKLGDRRIAGADAHWEQDFTAVCLPKDYYVEIKD